MECDYTTEKLDEVWKIALSQLQLDLSSMAFKTWFSSAKLLECSKGIAKITFPSTFIKDHVETHYRMVVKKAISKATSIPDLEPIFDISRDTYPESSSLEYNDPIFSTQKQMPVQTNVSTIEGPDGLNTYQTNSVYPTNQFKTSAQEANLNPRYTFEHFIVGTANKLAHAAALAVSDNPGYTYNPLFIYGGVGLGKTHLLQAMGIEILRKHPSYKVLYTPAEIFLNEMIEAIRYNKNLQFREKYRKIDVLIIDDIQVISGKEATQDELFHTYNILYQANKQIIFAADRPPKEIKQLTDRLRSRLEGGMIADIKAPDYETRLAILREKAEEKNFLLPESFLRIIADMPESNIRELEGALTKVGTFYYLNSQKLSDEDVKNIIKKDYEAKKKTIHPREVIGIVAKEFDLSISEIKNKRRTALLALARQVAMYFLRNELGLTLEETAKAVRRQDHTTVIHAIEKIEDMISSDDDFCDKVEGIRRRIKLLEKA